MLNQAVKEIFRFDKLKASTRIPVIRGLALVAALLMAGCATTQKDPKAVVSENTEAFNSGTPGAKNVWDAVVAAVNSDDYAGAWSALEQLRNEYELTPGQTEAVLQTEIAIQWHRDHPAQAPGMHDP